jgi:hypothetical protein
VTASDDRSFKEIKGSNKANKIGDFVRGRIGEVASVEREVIKGIVDNNKAKSEGFLDSSLEPNSVCEVLVLFDLLCIDLFFADIQFTYTGICFLVLKGVLVAALRPLVRFPTFLSVLRELDQLVFGD